MTDDLTLLASTYLDGAATPDERARVEADPDLLAEVERLRNARAAMLDARWFERPDDDVREATIAAALAAWDVPEADRNGSRADTRPAGPRPPVVALEQRRPYTRWLTAAAAAVVAVAGLGVIVAQFGGDDDTDSSTAIELSADIDAGAESSTEFAEQSGPPSDTSEALVSSGIAADDGGGGAPDSDAVAEATSPAATEAPADAADSADTAAAAEVASEPRSLAVMQTSQDLGVVAAAAKVAVENGTNPDVPARPCSDAEFDDIDTYVALGTYLDRSVVIGIDDEDDRAIAVDPDTCEIVAEAPLP
jgi:hypothetical protein